MLYFGEDQRYEGAFSQGKKHGKGREYEGDVLVREGTWLNDKFKS